MNTGTVLVIGGIAIAAAILLSKPSSASYGPYVPSAPPGGESDLNAGANAVGSFLTNSAQTFFGAAQSNGWL